MNLIKFSNKVFCIINTDLVFYCQNNFFNLTKSLFILKFKIAKLLNMDLTQYALKFINNQILNIPKYKKIVMTFLSCILKFVYV